MFKLINKKILLSICLVSALAVNSYATSCLKRAFDIKVKEETSANEIINQLSNICSFSVVYKDSYAKTALMQKQNGINMKKMHLKDIFDFLIKEQGLTYEFENNILRVVGLDTKTFKLDYITSIREGSAITKANVDSSSNSSSSNSSSSNSSSSSSSDDDNIIKTSEKFDFWKDIGKEIVDIMQNSGKGVPVIAPTINSNAGLITVTSNEATLDKIQSYLQKVENSLKKQVIIDVSIIEVNLDKSHKTGVDWSKFNLGFDTTNSQEAKETGIINDASNILFGKLITGTGIRNESKADEGVLSSFEGRLSFNLTGMLNFLKQSGDAKVVSNPKIATLNNQQALITVGDTINYKLKSSSTSSSGDSTSQSEEMQSIFVGILLNILPEISDDNKIMLRINPSISSLRNSEDNKSSANADRTIAPDTKQKKISTVVQVRDGESIVLGGLINESDAYVKNGIPVLQDIPLLGRLFGSNSKIKNKSELVFVITPHIVDFSKNNEEVQKSLEELGYTLALDYKNELKANATKDEILKK